MAHCSECRCGFGRPGFRPRWPRRGRDDRGRRAEVGGDFLNGGDGFIGQDAGGGDFAVEGGAQGGIADGGGLAFDEAEVEAQGGQELSKMVVDFAGEGGALVLAQGLEAEGQGAELAAGSAKRRSVWRREVVSKMHEGHGGAPSSIRSAADQRSLLDSPAGVRMCSSWSFM